VEDTGTAIPLTPTPAQPAQPARVPLPRWFAAIQVILTCGIPSQIAAAAMLVPLMRIDLLSPGALDRINSLEFVATMQLVDTAIIAMMIRVFLELSGEDSRTVFLGQRPLLKETLRGLALVPVIFVGVACLVALIRLVAPWLHTVKESPIQAYMTNPFDASIFLVVVMLGGGVKEELIRAFILHRFDQGLGGIRLGLALFSIMFGLLHFDQGWDVALAIGALGLVWGLIYMKRRSAWINMVSHAGFNAANVAQVMLARAFGA
jgi:membrane protease YdiL (CAAX protease family)